MVGHGWFAYESESGQMEGVPVGSWLEIEQQENDWMAKQPEHDCNLRMVG